MKDEIKRFRERRDARIKAKRADEEWITMHGTHVLIDDDGQVSKGPETLKSVVKSGGGYKSRAERKYGSNAKYAKALSNGWNQRNQPSAGKYIETLEKTRSKYDPKSQEHGEFKYKKEKRPWEAKEEKVEFVEPEGGRGSLNEKLYPRKMGGKTGAEEAREKMIDRNRPSAGEYIETLEKAGFGKGEPEKSEQRTAPRTRGEIMQANKKMYEKAKSDIGGMKPGIERDVTEKLILPWIKGNNWMGGLPDRKHQQIVSKMPYKFEDIQKEFDRQTSKYMA